jgi:predicted acyltransferase (DUF342 family)
MSPRLSYRTVNNCGHWEVWGPLSNQPIHIESGHDAERVAKAVAKNMRLGAGSVREAVNLARR